MKLVDIVDLIWSTWKRNKARTRLILSIISISLGVIVLALSLSFGLNDLTLGSLAHSGALKAVDVSSPDPDVTPLTQKTAAQLQRLKNVQSVAPSIELAGVAGYSKKTADINITMGTEGYFKDEAWVMMAGKRTFSSVSANEAIVTHATLKALGINSFKNLEKNPISVIFYIPDYDQTGGYRAAMPSAMVKKTAKKVKIIGVTSENYYQQVFVPLKLVPIKQPYYSIVRLRAKSQSSVTDIRKQVAELGLISFSYGDAMSDAQTLQRGAQVSFLLLGFFALLFTSMIAASTITISMLERAKEIATLKKLGMTDKNMRRLYYSETVFMILIGSLIGVGGAYILGWIFNLILWIIAKSQGAVSHMIFGLPIYYIPILIALAVIFGFIAGLIPAKKAARLNAAKN